MKTLGFVIRNFRNLGLCKGKKSQEVFLRLVETEGKFGGLVILFGRSNSGKSNLLRALEKFGNTHLSLSGSKEFEESKFLSQDDIPKLQSALPSITLSSQEPAYYLHYPQDVAQKSGEARKKQQMGKVFDFGEHIAELQDDFDSLDVYIEQNKHETISPIKILLKDSSTGGGRFMRCTIEPLKNRDDRSSDELNVSYSEKLACPFVVGYKDFDAKQNFADYINDNSLSIQSLAFKEYRLTICLDENQNLQQKYVVGNSVIQDGAIVSLSSRQVQELSDKKHEQLHIPRIVFYEETHFCDDDLLTTPDKIRESKLFKGEVTKNIMQITQSFNALCGVQESEEQYRFELNVNIDKFALEIRRGEQSLSLKEQGRDFRRLFDFIFSLNQQIDGLQKGDIVLIDNVEETLSIEAQKELRKFLKEFGQKTGILFIVSTHSPFMLDMNCLDEIRILKAQDNGLGFEIVNDFNLITSNQENILPATNGFFGIEYCHMFNPKSTIVIVESIEHYHYLTTFASLYAQNGGDMQFTFLPFHAFGKEEERKKAPKSLIELAKKIATPAVLLVENDCIGKEIQKAADDFSGRIRVVALNEVPELKARFSEQEGLTIEDLFAEEDKDVFGINKNNRGGIQSRFFKNATNHECLSQETKENFFALLVHLYCNDKGDIVEKSFLNALKSFYEQAVENARNGTTKGSKIVETENRFNEALEILGLKCAISFGSGKTADQQGIVFVRKDTLGKEYVNGETPSPTRGIYVWFCYEKAKYDEGKDEKTTPKEQLYLEFGYSWDDERVPCEAFKKLERDGTLNRDEWKGEHKTYSDFENHKDAILNDFLDFVSHYKSFDARDFRIQP